MQIGFVTPASAEVKDCAEVALLRTNGHFECVSWYSNEVVVNNFPMVDWRMGNMTAGQVALCSRVIRANTEWQW